MRKTLLLISLAIIAMAAQSDFHAYQVYNKEGKKTSFDKVLKKALKADVVLFGESHNNPISHWLQVELTKKLQAEKGTDLILGAEMFESDNQLLLDEYTQGDISQRSFESQARLWPNYKTDYKPLVELAKKHQLKFVASNIPRRYAALVNKKGFPALDSLSDLAKTYIAPLPMPYDSSLSAYQAMMTMMASHGMANPNLPKAQAAKDATMAHFIIQNLEKGKTLLHFHGTYHSNDFQGIYWYLNRYKKGLKIVTIASADQVSVDSLEQSNQGKADFIIITPDDMCKTH